LNIFPANWVFLI